MPRTTSAIKEAFLYLAILQRIPANSWVTVADIMNSLALAGIKVKLLTLQRYLQNLRESPEFGVECDMRAKPYAYRSSRSSNLLQADLSPEECLLYRLVEENLLHQLSKDLLQSLQPQSAKARESLKETQGNSRRRVARQVGGCPRRAAAHAARHQAAHLQRSLRRALWRVKS